MTHFMVKGERCSGTTYLENLIKLNLKASVLEQQGWKHGYFVSSHTHNLCHHPVDFLVLVIFRNPFDWLRSFYISPHHLLGTKKGHWVTKPTFSEFLTQEVKTVDEHDNETLLDYHPFLMQRPQNVLELRKWKAEHWLNYKNSGKPVYYVKYEDLVDNPEQILRDINDQWFNVDFTFQNWDFYKNSTTEYKPKTYFDLDAKDIIYIAKNIDWKLEARLGYKKNETLRLVFASFGF